MNRLDQTFARLKAEDELGLFPFLTVGYPDPDGCAELLDVMATAGADGIEFGVPFSDPLADGATLQRVGSIALEHGSSIQMALDLLRGFRQRHQTAAILMSYYNPLLAYGLDRLAADGAAAGLDGLIVPDLPIEEVAPLAAACRRHGLRVASFLAPTSTDQRIAATAEQTDGFIYCVALLGTTGARRDLSDELPAFLARVRARCPQPLLVGFGISRPEHVAAVRGHADGVIVGAAVADLISSTPPLGRALAVAAYIRELKDATRAPAAAPPA